VLSVIGFHYGVPGLSGGFVGVDIFFVISGYLISRLLVTEIDATGKIDLVAFYGRRARRLLPAALLVTLVTLAVSYILLSPLEQKEVAKSAAASSVYATNLLLLQQSQNYFAPQSLFNPFLHTWSLSVEEQFYLIWPTLILALGRTRGRTLQIGLALVTIVSFVVCTYLTHTKQAWAFYLSPARAWEFGVGGLASISSIERRTKHSISGAIIGWIGFLILIPSLFLIDEFVSFPGYVVAAPVFATAAILITGRNPVGPNSLLKQWPFQYVGKRSYAMYLWHWPIVVLGSTLFVTSAPVRLIYFVLTVALASASFVWLEHPVRQSRWLGQRASSSATAGLAMSLCGVIAGATIFSIARFVDRPTQTLIQESTSKSSISNENGCLGGFTVSTPIRCVFGPSGYKHTIVLFGDSHADQWTTALTKIAEQNEWRVITYLKASCSVSDVPNYSIRLRRPSYECAEWRRDATRRIIAERADAILISQFSSGYIKGPLTTLGPKAVELATWEQGLTKSISDLQSAKVPIIVLRDNPTPYFPIDNCLARADWRGSSPTDCARDQKSMLNDEVGAAEQRAISLFTNAHLIDLTASICSDGQCPAMRDGVIVYRDANHLTVEFTLTLEDKITASLLQKMEALAR